MTVDSVQEQAEEAQKIAELEDCLQALDVLQKAFLSLTTATEVKEIERRRCIVGISGLKHHTAAYFFEVKGGRIARVPPYATYNTYISAPLDTVLNVLKGVLAGDEDCFSNEWAKGNAVIRGDKHVHDGVMFGQAFKRVAVMVNRYRQYAR